MTTRVAGWYVTRKLDGYLDLTREQKSQVRGRVDTLLTEIRREELPRALYVMRLVRNAIAEDQVPQRIEELQERSDQLLEQAARRLIPELGWALSLLDDRQIGHLEGKLREKVDELYADQKLPPAERRAKLDAQLLEGLEKVVGDLPAPQRESILRAAHEIPDDRAARYRFDLRRIASTGELLRSHPGQAAIEAELQRLWATRYDVDQDRDKRSRRAEQRRFLLSVDRTMTEAQRKRAVENLNDRIRSLARFQLPTD